MKQILLNMYGNYYYFLKFWHLSVRTRSFLSGWIFSDFHCYLFDFPNVDDDDYHSRYKLKYLDPSYCYLHVVS